MGFVKVASVEPAEKNGYSCGDEDLTLDERMLLQSFPSHESDDCELAEVDCELAMSRGQMCNVPYGLYDLPELTEVLSLETWNLCLTEDDRFRLAAYLPDMDQYDFSATMMELFSGDAIFFGSPLRSIFHRLNSGFYSPEVSQARELLMILQRRRHYHFLKAYHDGMVRKFAYVDKLSRSSDISLGDKVCISQNWRYEKRLPCVDLSSSTLPIIIKSDADTSSPLKRAKLTDGTSTAHYSRKHNETVHRAKSMEMDSSKIHNLNNPYVTSENCSKLPKSVLKIRNGSSSLTDSSEGTHQSPGFILVDQPEMQNPSFCTPPYAFAHGFDENSASRSSPWQWKGALETRHTLTAESPYGVQKIFREELKGVNPSVMLGDFYQPAVLYSEAYDTREFPQPHEKNLLRNFVRQNNIVHQSSPDPYIGVSDDRQLNRYMKMQSLQNAEIISEMLNLGTSICPPCKNFSEQFATMRKYHDGLKLKAPLAKSVTKVEEAHRFPYIYTRKKLHKRPDIVDSVKNSTMLEDTISPSMLTSMANIKAKAI